MKKGEFYKNFLGIAWYLALPIILYFAFIGMGFSDTVSKIMTGAIWMISIFPLAKIINLMKEDK